MAAGFDKRSSAMASKDGLIVRDVNVLVVPFGASGLAVAPRYDTVAVHLPEGSVISSRMGK